MQIVVEKARNGVLILRAENGEWTCVRISKRQAKWLIDHGVRQEE